MRTLSEALTSSLTLPKKVNARLTFRRRKLTYSHQTVYDSLGLSDPAAVDVSAYDGGALRVVNSGNKLYTQFISDLSDADLYPAWTDTSITLYAGSRPGVHGERVWYQKVNGKVYYRDYSAWSTEVEVTPAIGYAATVAPVDAGAYVYYLSPNWGTIDFYTPGGVATSWPGRIYGDIQTARYIDAVTLNGTDYIYVMDRNAGRVVELRRIGSSWSYTRYVVPIDAIDNITGITLAYATVLDGKVFLTCRLSHNSDNNVPVVMDVFIKGPSNYTLGRWSFITTESVGGKLLVPGDGSVYYLGVNSVLVSDATIEVGVDNEDLKFQTSDIISLSFSEREGGGDEFGGEIAHDYSHMSLLDEVEFEFGYNGEYVSYGVYTIEHTEVTGTYGDATLSFTASSRGAEALASHTPHQSYYLASQSKVNDRPSALSNVIIASGHFDGNPLYNTKLNEHAVFYTAADASRSTVISAKFKIPASPIVSGKYGLIVNYYRESAYDVATRLGVSQSTVTTDMAQDHGIVALYSDVEAGGVPGFGIYHWHENTFDLLGTVEIAIPDDTWHWLKLSFIDGVIELSYRLDADAEWDLLLSATYNNADMPWKNDSFGRGAVYLENVSAHQASWPFYSGDVVVPVQDISAFSGASTVIVDDEQISITGTSPDIVATDELTVVEAAFRNDSFVSSGYAVVLDTDEDVRSDGYYNNCALVVNSGSGTGKAFKIVGYDAVAPQNWVPSGSYTDPDKWQDHVGDPLHGSWQASNKRRAYVSTDPSGVLAPGAKVQIVPALLVDERGANSTADTTHSGSVASVYSADHVLCDWVNGFTGDPDYDLEELIRYVLEVAGSDVSFAAYLNGNVSTTGTWGTSNWYSGSRSFISRLTLPSFSDGDEVGWVFRAPAAGSGSTADGPTIASGYMVTIQRDGSDYYAVARINVAGVWSILEKAMINFVPQGTLRCSVQDQVFSLWVNNYLVASFYDGTDTDGEYMALTSKTAKTFSAYYGELTDFISMWAIDAASQSVNILSEVISDRRVFFRTEPDGSIYFYRRRASAGEIPDIVFGFQHGQLTDVITWSRAEGAKFIETSDEALLQEFGIRYSVVNTRWAKNVDDTVRWARWMRADQYARSRVTILDIVPHPGIQVGDCLTVDLPIGTQTLDVMALSTSLSVTQDGLTFTQNLQGIAHASL
jgi:hypothetical protein